MSMVDGDDEPLVSVVMPVWNHADFLPDAIEGIVKQTYNNWELIIIVDPSDDNTVEVAEWFEDTYDRITVNVNDERLHLTKSFNKGLGMANGELITINDADDISSENRFEIQVEAMRNRPNLILTCQHDFYAKKVDGCGGVIARYRKPEDYHYPPESAFFPHTFTIIHSSWMMRNVGQRYREKFKHTQDVDLYSRFFTSNYNIEVLKENLITRRVHENQIQSREKKYNYNEMAIRDMNKRLKGWNEQYQDWDVELPYEVDDKKEVIK